MSQAQLSPARQAPASAESGVIELHLREVRQLFDAMDPSPFREKDLDPDADAYIFESAEELPSRSPGVLRIHLDQATGLPDEERAIGDAVRAHFARRSVSLRRNLHRLIRRGFMSLAIGLSFLVSLFVVAQWITRVLGHSDTALLLRECLLIGGWVALWRPLEIFLYDWWPIVGEKRVHEKLSCIDTRVIHSSNPSSDELGRILTGQRGNDPLAG